MIDCAVAEESLINWLFENTFLCHFLFIFSAFWLLKIVYSIRFCIE